MTRESPARCVRLRSVALAKFWHSCRSMEGRPFLAPGAHQKPTESVSVVPILWFRRIACPIRQTGSLPGRRVRPMRVLIDDEDEKTSLPRPHLPPEDPFLFDRPKRRQKPQN